MLVYCLIPWFKIPEGVQTTRECIAFMKTSIRSIVNFIYFLLGMEDLKFCLVCLFDLNILPLSLIIFLDISILIKNKDKHVFTSFSSNVFANYSFDCCKVVKIEITMRAPNNCFIADINLYT